MTRGPLRKMRTRPDTPVGYGLPLGESVMDLQTRIGGPVEFRFENEILCANCGRKTKKSYSQGHCFPCSRKLAACDLCVLQPSRCHYDQGTCREPDWGDTHCMQPHLVYLANTSGLKVGITRARQAVTRWMDQGASQALPLMRAATRQIAGLVEASLARHVSDRTDWRAMLRGAPAPLDLLAERERLIAICGRDLADIQDRFGTGAFELSTEAEVASSEFPVMRYPEKIRPLSFDRTPTVSGILEGIKGQYLILDSGVLNVRKFCSYVVSAQG